MLSDLRDSRRFCVDTLGYYIECYNVFGDDLVEGVIPVNHYLRSISNVEKELMEYCRRNNIRCASMSVFEKSERYSELASRLLVKRKSDDAIVILEKALELNPLSVSSYNRIMQAYRQKKNQEKVNHYSARMEEVLKNPGNYIR
jgi:tetratricopeptide (TPR) repeat protein